MRIASKKQVYGCDATRESHSTHDYHANNNILSDWYRSRTNAHEGMRPQGAAKVRFHMSTQIIWLWYLVDEDKEDMRVFFLMEIHLFMGTERRLGT